MMARDMRNPRNLTLDEMVEWSRTAPVGDVLREAGNSISMYVDVLAERVANKDR